MIKKVFLLPCFLCFLSKSYGQIQPIQGLLDSLQKAGNFPGLSFAFVDRDNRSVSFVTGFNDKEKNLPLKKTDRMLQGSVGKTYVSAVALRLVQQGKLDLDEKVSAYLGRHGWYQRIPNAASITVRMILNHSSGVMRYEYKKEFLEDLTADPGKSWKPAELLQYVLGEKASFPAGEGWEYSDTNYILLGMIIEQITGRKYYDLLRSEILLPNGLNNTLPSESRRLQGLSQGYAGDDNEFGGKDRVIGEDGLFIINPQFEWTGGGIYSTTEDLAGWGKLLYEGKIIDTGLLLSSAVPAKLGRDSKYGLGVIIRATPLSITYGHSGFFPGYLTELAYFPEHQVCLAIQCNSSDFKKLKLSLQRCLALLAKEVLDQ